MGLEEDSKFTLVSVMNCWAIADFSVVHGIRK